MVCLISKIKKPMKHFHEFYIEGEKLHIPGPAGECSSCLTPMICEYSHNNHESVYVK